VAAVEVVLDDLDERGFDGYASVPVAFAADVDHRAVGGTPEVADVAVDEFLRTQAGEKRGQDDRPITFGPVAAALLLVVYSAATSSPTALWCNAFGRVFVVLGRPTWGLGLAGMSSAVNR
jgi:hypothetical protein